MLALCVKQANLVCHRLDRGNATALQQDRHGDEAELIRAGLFGADPEHRIGVDVRAALAPDAAEARDDGDSGGIGGGVRGGAWFAAGTRGGEGDGDA